MFTIVLDALELSVDCHQIKQWHPVTKSQQWREMHHSPFHGFDGHVVEYGIEIADVPFVLP